MIQGNPLNPIEFWQNTGETTLQTFHNYLTLILVECDIPFSFVKNLEPTFFSMLQLFVLWIQALILKVHHNLGPTVWTHWQPTMIDLISTLYLGLSFIVELFLLFLTSGGCSAIHWCLHVVCLFEALTSGILNLDCFGNSQWVWLPKMNTKRVWNMLIH